MKEEPSDEGYGVYNATYENGDDEDDGEEGEYENY